MPRAVMGSMFFPRGGSAHVARALARELPAHGWDVTVVAGSLGHGGHGDARRFYAGLDVRPVDYTAAARAGDPLAADTPMQPSYEDRPDAPDRVFARVDDAAYERLVDAWARALRDAGAAGADVLHLSHLTPLNEAAARVAPDVPVVAHIHGTELLMLEQIGAGPPPGWDHAGAWAARMRRWAAAARRVIVLSEAQLDRVEGLLGVPAKRCAVVPNGFDPLAFDRRPVDRRAHWRRHLVAEPQGWRPGAAPGSVSYTERDLAPLFEGTALLYVGRFTAVKRVGLLIRAHARAQEASAGAEGAGAGGAGREGAGTGARTAYTRPAALVLLGGFPGEWEGEHPLEAVAASGARDVFLAGWHDHDALPDFLNASDAVVLPSVREQFGLVLVEGMACGLPAIAADAGGPSLIVEHGRTGWLVAPDDEAALADALVRAVNDPAERRRRGEAAWRAARARYAWPALAQRLTDVYRAARET
jgi:glycosyltransferase involved in cell wall biosynthesis